MRKIYSFLSGFFLIVFCLSGVKGWGQAFSGTYNFDSVIKNSSGTTDPTPVPTATGVTFGSFTAVGTPVNPNANSRFSFTDWAIGATPVDTSEYYQVTITPQSGYSLDINTITFTLQRSGTGIRQYIVRSSSDSYASNLPASINPLNSDLSVVATNVFQVSDGTTNPETGSTITLGSSFDAITSAVSFRFYGYNSEGSGGTFSIDDVVISGIASTLSLNSSSSDIIQGTSFTVPSNIAYKDYQSNDITNANSVRVAKFTIRDGGAAAGDADAVGTTLKNLTFGLTNSSNIRSVAIYDDADAEIAEMAASASIAFTNLNITAADGGTKDFYIRVTYNSTVNDNQQYQFSFSNSNVTADAAGSSFTTFSASSSTSGDANRIEVTATKIDFTTQPPSTPTINTNLSPQPVVAARDANNNTDLDYASALSVSNSNSLSMINAPTTFSSGTATFPSGFQFTSVAATTTTLTVSSGSLTSGTSNAFSVLSAQPTAQPTAFVRTAVTTTTMTIAWTAATGSPDGYIVLRTTASGSTYPNTNPADGNIYTAGNTLGNATVMYVGSSLNTAVSSLTQGSQYRYEIYSYNGSGSSINYNTGSPLQGQAYTLANEPSSHSNTFSVSTFGPSSITFNIQALSNITNASGYNILYKAGNSAPVTTPVDGVAFATSGDAVLGANTNNTSVTTLQVIGLTAGQQYTFRLYPYGLGSSNDTTRNYKTDGTVPEITFTLPNSQTDVVAVSASEAATISSLINDNAPLTDSTGIKVWSFTIRDGGASASDSDGLPTKILDITIARVNSSVDYSANFKTAALFDNSGNFIATASNITSSSIVFSGLNISVANNSSSTYNLRLSLKTTLSATADGSDLGFSISNTNVTTVADGTSSATASLFIAAESSNGQNLIAVVATKLRFVQQPGSVSVVSAISPAPTVEGTDANNNRDLDFTSNVTLSISTGTTTFNSNATTTVAANLGLATFSNLRFNTPATGNTLIASASGVAASGNSSPFDVTGNPTAGLQIIAANNTYTIDFDNTVSGVNNGQYAGSGLQSSPSTGKLNSNAWAIVGMSDGNTTFGGTDTSGDFARGNGGTLSSLTTGGLYGFLISTGNAALGVQPSADDFTPGHIVLRIQNSTASSITTLNIAYKVYIYNDAPRSNSFDLYHGDDYSNLQFFANAASVNTTTPVAADGTPGWKIYQRVIRLTGLDIPPSGYYYLDWYSNDLSGSGSRDLIALDDIIIVANPVDVMPQFSGTAQEIIVDGTAQLSGNVNNLKTLSLLSGATLDAQDNTISFTTSATATINGTFKTANANGFNGAANTALTNTNNPIISLQAGSTIEYSNSGAQTITARTDYKNVTISGSGTKSLSGATTIGNALTLSAGILAIGSNTLTLNGDVTTTSGVLDGTSSSNLILGGTSAQTLSFASNGSLNNLTLGKSSGTATLSSALNVYGAVTWSNTGGTLALGTSNLVLKSSLTGTARIGEIPTGKLTGGTSVTAERFIGNVTPKRAWRLLSSPVSGVTIYNAWQDTAQNHAGYGTLITKPGGGNGFDAGGVTPSIKTFNGTAWVTSQLTATNAGDITDYQGYFVFVRGDRTVGTGASETPKNTTLRAKGTLRQGTLSNYVTVTSGVSNFTLLGNPYPSAIDFEKINQAYTTLKNFYAWDPSAAGANGVGAYNYVERTGAGAYDVTPQGGTASGNNSARYIPSGAAVLIEGPSSGGNVSVTMQESFKDTGTTSLTYFRTASTDQNLAVNLVKNAALMDGFRIRFDNSYFNETTDDATKLWNNNENMSLARNGKAFIVERRKPVTQNDTAFVKIYNLPQDSYQLHFYPSNFAGVEAYLIDAYAGTTTPVSLTSNTNYSFTVDANAASGNQDRFRIVFQPNTILPVTFTSIKARQANGNAVQVEWSVAGESGIKAYDVETSADGRSFSKAATVSASGNNSGAVNANYNWLHTSPVAGTNYYRVKSIGWNGDVKYTSVVSVKLGKGKAEVSVHPNPVKDNIISLQMLNLEKGNYTMRMYNAAGQQVMSKTISHGGGSSWEQIGLPALAKGIYKLEVTGNDYKNTQTILIQ